MERRLALLAELQDLGYDEDDISGDPAPKFAFSEVTTVVEAAPDEEAMLQAVMIRLAKRGNYDSLIAELAISTLGPHDIDKLAEFLDSLNIDTPKHTISDDKGKALVECVACEDQLPPKDLILAACGHCYCGTCLDMVFNAAVLDESLYPPSCCENTPLPIEHAKRFLEPGMVETFNAKGVEFSTVDRTYCSDPTCSTFIPPSDIHGDTAVCDGCGKQTCVVCKAPTHPGDCPADEKLKALLEHAEKMRWQRCYNCLRVVQRLDGCSHIDCRCGAGFCYNCGRRSQDGDTCPCALEIRGQAQDRDSDPDTGGEIIYNYRFYRRPADGSRLRGPPVDEWQDRDEHGWPVGMDQAERRRILDEHVRAQARILQEREPNLPAFEEEIEAGLPAPDLWSSDEDSYEYEESESAYDHAFEEDPGVPGVRIIGRPRLPEYWVHVREDTNDTDLVSTPPETPMGLWNHIGAMDRHWPPTDAVSEPQLDAPEATATDDDPWKLADDPTACLHPEWWNHQGTATYSVCETDSRRTLHCPDCEIQVCRRCRDRGRVPYGFIQLPWTGGETFGGGFDPDVGS
ncbi:hypothetical protein D6D01_01960 [Aureobasidium pullulans]|uniref:RBR-type E3 ubiquitin transferase n=1 Tax=Aureobasidium pullulans TaxID=5580 RepID=A0A4S9LWZ4_AURPU|nr:hypothetical protein D6D01_01960 [Aureobasidium pullulans]